MTAMTGVRMMRLGTRRALGGKRGRCSVQVRQAGFWSCRYHRPPVSATGTFRLVTFYLTMCSVDLREA